MYYGVIPEERLAFGSDGLTYSSNEDIALGTLVIVPFGKRLITGIVIQKMETVQMGEIDIRAIHDVISHTPVMSTSDIELMIWLAQYYATSIRSVLQVFLPSPPWKNLRNTKISVLIFCSEKPVRGEKQKKVLEYMKNIKEADEHDVRSEIGASKETIDSLIATGIIRREEREKEKIKQNIVNHNDEMHQKEEVAVVIDHRSFEVKEEEYEQRMKAMLQSGKTSLLLLPNIFMAEEVYERMQVRMPGYPIVCMHGNTKRTEECRIRNLLENNTPLIIIGTKVGLFLPTPTLGLIILEEEHERVWKNEQSPRYHARLVAEIKAKKTGATLLLVSAHPSLDSLQHTERIDGKEARYQCIVHNDRNNIENNHVTLINLQDANFGSLYPCTTPLMLAIKETMERKEVNILLINQRGTGSSARCMTCGHILKKQNAEFPYTIITRQGVPWMLEKQSGEMIPMPETCPECSGTHIRVLGAGTERVEEILKNTFPHARIVRADGDTLNTPYAMKAIVAAIERREVDILLGTQSVLAALQCKAVTCAALLVADQGLSSHDIRAGERVFQTVSRVVHSMKHRGKAIVQAFHIDAPEITYAIHMDPLSYARHELPLRRTYNYPPATRMIDVIIRDAKNMPLHTLFHTLQQKGQEIGVKVTIWEKRSYLSQESIIRLFGKRVRELLPLIPRKGIVINVDPME